MINNNPSLTTTDSRAWVNWLAIIIYVAIGMFVGQFLGLIVILPFYGFDLMEAFASIMDFGDDASRMPMLILQGITATCAFVLAPYLYLKRFTHHSVPSLLEVKGDFLQPVVLVFGITICFMFVNSIFIEWNKSITFPDYMAWFESYAKEKEILAEQITIFLTKFNSLAVFLFSMVVIALLPALGEELLFRGVIQNLMGNSVRNAHVAIWLTAILFSAFHFQFYGFVPRMLLGALFGYLYYWSGSLLYAVVGHFVNNGFTLLMLYLHQTSLIDFDIEGTDDIPLQTVIFFLIVGIILTFLFVRIGNHKKIHPTDG